jgi:hypothetical protein
MVNENPTASIYIQLSHPQYKALEEQLRNWAERETAHTSTEGFYHKSISFVAAGVRWEFHGPIVKAAEPEPDDIVSGLGINEHGQLVLRLQTRDLGSEVAGCGALFTVRDSSGEWNPPITCGVNHYGSTRHGLGS